ncbi:MAG: hypothetical protein WCC59_01500 [Terriglobales bacterium]
MSIPVLERQGGDFLKLNLKLETVLRRWPISARSWQMWVFLYVRREAALNAPQSRVPGKTVLRDFINATVGFTKLGQVMHRSPKGLMRMLGPTGNPHAKNLFEIVAFLQRHERVRFKVQSSSAAA